MPKNKFIFINNSHASEAVHFVFLPGWGFSGRIVELTPIQRNWLIPAEQPDPNTLVTELADFLAQNRIGEITLAGWSLGANLAIDFALRYPEKIKALYLLGMRHSWPDVEIEEIGTGLNSNPKKFMKSFYRKCFLGHQADYRKFTASFEKQLLEELDLDRLETGLSYLNSFALQDKCDKLTGQDFPIYILHGAKDIIAPLTEMAAIPGAASRIIKSSGHPVFLDPACPLDWHRKKETIRQKFSRSAATYDDHAVLQKELAKELCERLPETPPATILETGCGTGAYTTLLNKRYPAARITALDFAEKMIERAREKLASSPKVNFLCNDAELFLQNTQERFDLVTSNATMHWFDDLKKSLESISKSLNIRGSLICSIFGPETMREMQVGIREIHGKELLMPSSFFPAKEELKEILSGLFQRVEIKETQKVRRYSDLNSLLKNISKTGTAGWHPGKHLLNRRQIKELERWFKEKYGLCKVSYQIFMINCRK